MTVLHLLNKKQEVIHILPRKEIIELWQNDGINELDTINATIKLTEKNKEILEKTYYYALQDIDEKNTFHLYKSVTSQLDNSKIEIFGLQVGFDELKANGYVKDYRPQNRAINEVLTNILNGTGWELGFVDSRINKVTSTFYYLNKLEALRKVIELTGCEVDFKVSITGNKVSMRYLDVYYQMGNDSGKRFAYGTNALEIVKENDVAELYTALIGRGKGEELEGDSDGYGRRIMFTDIEWKKTSGKPLNKPIGQEYLEIPEATNLYGYPDGKPRIGITVFEDIENKEELIQATYNELKNVSRPKVQFKATVANTGDLKKGDTVTIVRHELGIKYQTRVFNVKRNRLKNDLTQISLGDVIVQSEAKKNANFTTNINNKIESVKEDLKNVSIIAADGTKINYGLNTPLTAKVDDLWYEELLNGKINLRKWNGAEWGILVNDLTGEEVKAEVNNALDDMAVEKERIDGVIVKADQAIEDAGFAQIDATNSLEKIVSVEANLNGLQTTVLDKADKSQFTQLAGQISTKVESEEYNSRMDQLDSAINLRVQKDEVITQINLSAEKETILIEGKSIQLDGDVKMTNAFVEKIKAIEVIADKITSGTLNASKVNIINLNASKIVANTLSALTANTGTLNVTGYVNILNSNTGIYGSYDYGSIQGESYNPKWFDGEWRLGTNLLSFKANAYDLTGSNGKGRHAGYFETQYGSAFTAYRKYSNSTNKILQARVDIQPEMIQIADNWNDLTAGVILQSNGTISASGITARDNVTIGRMLDVNGESLLRSNVDIKGNLISRTGARFEGVIDGRSAMTLIGNLTVGSKLDVTGATIVRSTVDIQGSLVTRSTTRFEGSSQFTSSVSIDGKLQATNIYANTQSQSANVFVSSYGYLFRATSASKYKLNIEELKDEVNYAKRILNVKPKTWHDKHAATTYSDYLTEKELGNNPKTNEGETLSIARSVGLIAEDLEEVGLSDFVTKSVKTGEIEGIEYSMLHVIYIPLIKDLYRQIEQQNKKIQQMEGDIK